MARSRLGASPLTDSGEARSRHGLGRSPLTDTDSGEARSRHGLGRSPLTDTGEARSRPRSRRRRGVHGHGHVTSTTLASQCGRAPKRELLQFKLHFGSPTNEKTSVCAGMSIWARLERRHGGSDEKLLHRPTGER